MILIDIRHLSLNENILSNNFSFGTLFIDLNDSFYYNKDDASGDIFKIKLTEKRLEIEGNTTHIFMMH